jgi:transposase
MKKEEIKTQSLDHHGLVAAIAKDLKIVERIDKRLGDKHELSFVSIGQRVLAMIINGLGFTDERLYMVSSFFKDKPVEQLIGPQVKAAHLNDDTLAKALDAIAAYGSTKLFAEIAYEIGLEEGLLNGFAHLDTTSFSLEGSFEGVDCPRITFGFSKDHRADLKQVILSLTTSGPSSFPIWMEALDGNSSDKASFHKTIANMTAFQKELKLGPSFTWVADAALYTKDKLLKTEGILWITRVPESIKEAKELCNPHSANFYF